MSIFPNFGFGRGEFFQNLERFDNNYTAHSIGLYAAQNMRETQQLENSDKIFLPPRALDELVRKHIAYPMLFEMSNPAYPEGTGGAKKVHCGVLEFVADEGCAYIPYWLMQNLGLEEGDMVNLKSAMLPKGSYVKLRPRKSEFLKITNPRAVLESRLRNFSCLTQGQTISFEFNRKTYELDVMEVRGDFGPNHTCDRDAVSIIETDIEVDFAPPADQPDIPQQQERRQELPSFRSKKSLAEVEKNEESAMSNSFAFGSTTSSSGLQERSQEKQEQSQLSFNAFSGSGYTLRQGKLEGTSPAEAAREAALRRLGQQASSNNSVGMEKEKGSGFILSGPLGKTSSSTESDFKPFEGEGYSLRR